MPGRIRDLLGSISYHQAAQLPAVSEASVPLYPDARALAKPTRPLLLPVLSQCGWQHPGLAMVLLSMNNTPNSVQPMQHFLGEEQKKFYPSSVAHPHCRRFTVARHTAGVSLTWSTSIPGDVQLVGVKRPLWACLLSLCRALLGLWMGQKPQADWVERRH